MKDQNLSFSIGHRRGLVQYTAFDWKNYELEIGGREFFSAKSCSHFRNCFKNPSFGRTIGLLCPRNLVEKKIMYKNWRATVSYFKAAPTSMFKRRIAYATARAPLLEIPNRQCITTVIPLANAASVTRKIILHQNSLLTRKRTRRPVCDVAMAIGNADFS